MEPSSRDLEFFVGSTKAITYQVKNNGEFNVKDMNLLVYTVKNSGTIENPKYVETDKNYARIMDAPNMLNPYEVKNVRVEVTVPPNYNESVKKNGKDKIVPFYIKFKIRGIEHIEE